MVERSSIGYNLPVSNNRLSSNSPSNSPLEANRIEMSNIDQYQRCVCGSGKKIKFCKCGANDNTTELERIFRLIEGDQDLAALDRINSLLNKLPNAAWLLALKARILMQMNEPKSLAEVAHRFLKLKPDNPVALFLCSIAAYVQEEPIQNQARYVLSGMAESRTELPADFAVATDALLERLLHSRTAPFLGIWGVLQLGYDRHEGSKLAIQSPRIHLLCKVPNKLIQPPPDATWLERIDEVRALVHKYLFEQAEKKLHAILREFPNQPSALTMLLKAQVAQLDEGAALATAQKLAEHSGLSVEDRVYFKVLAGEYDPTTFVCNEVVRFGEIESDDKLIEALQSMDWVKPIESDYERYYGAELAGDEVPAKQVFQILSQQKINGRELHSHIGTIYVLGKQTDRPARALLIAFDYPPDRPMLDQVISRLEIVQELESPIKFQTHYATFLTRPARYMDSDESLESFDERGSRLIEEFVHLPLPYLNNQTPLEAADNPELQEKLKAVLFHLEGDPAIVISSSAFDELYQRLNLERPKVAADSTDVQANDATFLDDVAKLARTQWRELSDPQLKSLYSLLLTLNFPRAILEAAQEIVTRPSLISDPKIELQVRSTLASMSPNPSEQLGHSQRLIDLLIELELPVGQAVMNHASLLQFSGQGDEAKQFFSNMLREHPDDPQLLMLMQRMMAQAQQRPRGPGLAPGPLPGLDADDSQASGSSLVLPGQSEPAQTESKLWLPGT